MFSICSMKKQAYSKEDDREKKRLKMFSVQQNAKVAGCGLL